MSFQYLICLDLLRVIGRTWMMCYGYESAEDTLLCRQCTLTSL